MITSDKSPRIQTAFRFEPLLLERVKEAARRDNLSVNEYVSGILAEATKDIITDKEMEERRRETDEFLEKVSGKWVGNETTEEIMKKIKEGSRPWKIVKF